MPFAIPPDAPSWVHNAYWIGFVAIGLFFVVLVPRLRNLLPVAPPAQPDLAMRVQGAILSAGYDASKVAEGIERIAIASETIAEATRSLARSEEAGTARALGTMVEQLARLDRRIDGR